MTLARKTLIVVAVLGTSLACAPPEEEPAAEERVVAAFLPAGDAAAGREAFVMLHCYACHQVAGDPDLPATVATEPGPVLGPAQASLSQGELVSAIVVPSHAVVEPREEFAEGELSRMGDFTQVMTVRQLVDVVSYLEGMAQP
jgi:L-cysteine S-thiosulfotransferase